MPRFSKQRCTTPPFKIKTVSQWGRSYLILLVFPYFMTNQHYPIPLEVEDNEFSIYCSILFCFYFLKGPSTAPLVSRSGKKGPLQSHLEKHR